MSKNIHFRKNKFIFNAISIVLLVFFCSWNDINIVQQQFNSGYALNNSGFDLKKTALTTFLKLDSIGAASGIVYHEKNLYLISDNSGFLSKYDIKNKTTTKFALIANPGFNIAKKIKPDFESIAFSENKFWIYGSGSTTNRQEKVSFDVNSHEVTSKNMKECYKKFQVEAQLSESEFNIEGVFFDKYYSYYCQRGNKAANKNCLFRMNRETDKIDIFYFVFPQIGGVFATFTDAILINKTIYFLASAENTISTYYDGEIMGTVFGTIDAETMQVKHQEVISMKHKFEGITLFKESKKEMNFLLCEDTDTDSLEAEIFELSFIK